MINEAFNILNPPDSWLHQDCECPACGETIEVSIPKEVRGSEWWCGKCSAKLSLRVRSGIIMLKSVDVPMPEGDEYGAERDEVEYDEYGKEQDDELSF